MAMRIRVAGLGDIGPYAVWGQTQLESAAQGTPSEGTIAIRDLGFLPTDFVTGARVEVDLGPDTRNIWGGYLIRSTRSAWFPADDPDRKHRLWVLHLYDNNILFSKRVVAKLSDPSKVEGPIYTATAYDDDVIAALVSGWLDISGDGIDTSSLVERVASIYYGQPTYPWNAGFTWGEAMDVISQLPAAVYALDPDWNLIYGDVDDTNLDFILHNNPRGGSGRHGYRESTIWRDASRMANDFFAWGFGKGANHGVFKRETDSSSIDDHLRWQDSYTAYDVWKQSTIDKVADSAVNGSPTSHRGRKNDRVAVELVTMEHGLRVADRVRYVNTSEDFDDVLPVRKLVIQPITATEARYEATLSHEIDRWGFQDPSPPWSIPRFPLIDIPWDGGGGIPGTGCTCFQALSFDNFDRDEVGPDWGPATGGAVWTSGGSGTVVMAVSHNDPSNANYPQSVGGGIETHAVNDIGYQTSPLPFGASSPFTCSFEFEFDQIFGSPINVQYIVAFGAGSGANTGVVMFLQTGASTVQVTTPAGTSDITDFDFVAGTIYSGEFKVSDNVAELRIWVLGDARPDAALAFASMDGNPLNGTDMLVLATQPSPQLIDVTWDSWLHHVTFNADQCGTPLDDFERTNLAEWGTATNGYDWVNTGGGGSAYSVVDGKGKIVFDETQNDEETLDSFVPTLPLDMAFLGVNLHSTYPGIPPTPPHNRITFEFTDFGNGLEVGLTRPGNVGVLVGSFAGNYELGFDVATIDGVNIRIVSSDGKTDVAVYVWLPGEPMPTSPQIVGTGIDGTRDLTTLKVFTAAISFVAQTVTAEIGGIVTDMRTDCPNDCSDTAFDTFEGRDVDPGWGDASSGPTWTRVGGSNGISVVSAGYGILQNGSSSTTEAQSVVTGLPADGDFSAEVHLAVSSDDDVIDSSFIFATLGFGWHHNTGGAHPYLYLDDNISGRQTVNFDDGFWASVTGIGIMRVERTGSVARLKLWDSDTTEPPWQLEVPVGTGGYSIERASFQSLSTSSVGTQSVFIDSISFTACEPPAPTGGVPATFGELAFLATRVDATTYTVPVKYTAGSSQVFVSGLRQRPSTDGVTRDYTEDPDNGRIFFTADVSPADVVKMIVIGGGGGVTGNVAQFPGSGPSTEAAFADLAANLSVDIIEIAADTYADWSCFLGLSGGPNHDRTSAHPLLVRPAPGADVVWDGGGGSNPPWRIGWTAKASYITFDPAGTGGSFKMQNYALSLSGLVMPRWIDHVTFNGVIVRDCYGTHSAQTEHCVYVGKSTDADAGAGRSQYWQSSNWDVVGPVSNRWLNGFQTDTSSGSGECDHIIVHNWAVSLLHRASFLWADPTDVSFDGWTITDCDATIDTSGANGTQGTVSNCHATNSGPLARGSGQWTGSQTLLDGGGNTAV